MHFDIEVKCYVMSKLSGMLTWSLRLYGLVGKPCEHNGVACLVEHQEKVLICKAFGGLRPGCGFQGLDCAYLASAGVESMRFDSNCG